MAGCSTKIADCFLHLAMTHQTLAISNRELGHLILIQSLFLVLWLIFDFLALVQLKILIFSLINVNITKIAGPIRLLCELRQQLIICEMSELVSNFILIFMILLGQKTNREGLSMICCTFPIQVHEGLIIQAMILLVICLNQ